MNKLIEVIGNNINYKLPVILDIETTGTYRFTENVTSVQLKWVHKDTQEVKEDFLVWSDYSIDEWTEFLQMFKDMKAKLITHGGKFDLLFLYHNTKVLLQVFADTLVMAHVLGEYSLALKDLVGRYYRDFYDISLKDKIGKVTKKLIEYGIKDVRYTEKLYHKFKQKIIDNDLVTTYRHELRAYNAYIIVESKGVYVNPNKEKTRAYLQGEYKPLEEKLKEVANINWNSSIQVASILFNPIDCEIRSNPKSYKYWHVDLADGRDLWGSKQTKAIKFKTKKEATAYVKEYFSHIKLKEFIFTQCKKEQTELLGYGLGLDVVKYTDSGNPSTDDEVLSKLEDKHEIIPVLKEWKRLTKLEKFIDSWEKLMTDDGCIHPSFNITARTGRTTCKEPNLQQVPQNSHVRNMICAREGYKIIELDYSQLELRITAELSGDKNMIKAYKEGKDLHALTVKNLFGDIDLSDPDTAKRYRTYGKSANFGFIYGMQPRAFIDYAKGYGLSLSMKEAKEFRESFLRGYPALPDWWEESKAFARTYGYSETLTGRKRFLPDIWSPNFADSSSAERQSINSPVQGFGSDICISAMADIVFSKELDHSKFHVIGTVHDAILMEVKEDYAEELGRKAKEIMEKPTLLKDIELDVPLVADLEISWAWGGH